MLELIAGAGVAGVVGSVHCIGMCGSFAVACGGSARGSLFWHLGRITTYAVLGALAGAFGGIIPGPGWLAGVLSTALIVYFAAVLAGLVPEPHIRIPGVRRAAGRLITRQGAGPRYLFGLVNGLLPCGLVYATLAVPVALGEPVAGAAAMILFGLGTVPALATVTFGLRRIAFRDIRVRRLLAAGVLVAGLWSIGMRQGVLGSGHGMDHGDHDDHGDHGAPASVSGRVPADSEHVTALTFPVARPGGWRGPDAAIYAAALPSAGTRSFPRTPA